MFDIRPSKGRLEQSRLSLHEWAGLLRESCPPTVSAKLLAKAFGSTGRRLTTFWKPWGLRPEITQLGD